MFRHFPSIMQATLLYYYCTAGHLPCTMTKSWGKPAVKSGVQLVVGNEFSKKAADRDTLYATRGCLANCQIGESGIHPAAVSLDVALVSHLPRDINFITDQLHLTQLCLPTLWMRGVEPTRCSQRPHMSITQTISWTG